MRTIRIVRDLNDEDSVRRADESIEALKLFGFIERGVDVDDGLGMASTVMEVPIPSEAIIAAHEHIRRLGLNSSVRVVSEHIDMFIDGYLYAKYGIEITR